MREGRSGSPVRWRRVALAAILAVLVAIGFSPVVTTGSADDRISLTGARAHVEAISTEPHPMGSREIRRVRDYLVAALTDIGLTPELQTAPAPDYFRPGGGETEIANVIARLPGTGAGDAILLVAHHDTVPDTPGANDNTAAVAALLETGRVLVDGPPLENDVILLFTDGEEPTPRFGMSAFTGHPWFGDVKLVVNLEALGEAGPALLVELNGSHRDLLSGLSDAVTAPGAFSFMTATADLIGGAATDFDVIRNTDVPGFGFATLRGSAIYHTARDSVDRLNERGMLRLGGIAIGIARQFGNEDLEHLHGDDRSVFFTLPPRLVVVHPAWLSWPLIAAGAALTVFGTVRTRRRDATPLRMVARATGIVFAGGILGAVVLTAAWMWVVGARPTMGVIETYVALTVIACVVALSWVGVARLAGDRPLSPAILILWGIFAAGATLASPGLGVQFVWVFLLAAAWFAASSDGRIRRPQSLALAVVAGSAAVVLMVPVIDTFFLLSGPRPGNPDSELSAVLVLVVLITYALVALVSTVAPGWWMPAGGDGGEDPAVR